MDEPDEDQTPARGYAPTHAPSAYSSPHISVSKREIEERVNAMRLGQDSDTEDSETASGDESDEMLDDDTVDDLDVRERRVELRIMLQTVLRGTESHHGVLQIG